jgi:saccharopine dehydrogenase (NADP+, L-glutamate forming)
MSKLVGLPLGIFVKLLMQGKIATTGVNIPTMPEVYEPIILTKVLHQGLRELHTILILF